MEPILLVLPMVGEWDESLLVSISARQVPRLGLLSVNPSSEFRAYPRPPLFPGQQENGVVWMSADYGASLFSPESAVDVRRGSSFLNKSWLPPLDIFTARAIVSPQEERLFRVVAGEREESEGTGFQPLCLSVERSEFSFPTLRGRSPSFIDADGGLQAELEALEQSEQALYEHLTQMGRLVSAL
ncbi:MAG: hypothetical protein VYD19_09555 [Myxococcota bacterium]|nr:hypothetical protein [Myxococcota bacterium]